MTTDELADALAANMTELRSKIGELADGSFKRKLARLDRVAHGALVQIQEEVLNQGMIQPFSGGDPNKDDPPSGP